MSDSPATPTDEPAWPSGVGGSQCDECDRITIVRGFEPDLLGLSQRYVCRACYEGWYGDWDECYDEEVSRG